MLQSPFFEKEALSAESIFVLNNNSPRLVEDEPGDILQRAIRETSEDFDQNSTDFNIPFTKSVDVTPCQGHNQIVSATLPLRNAPNRNEKAQVNPSALLSMHHLSPPKEDHTVLSGDVNQIQIIQHGNSFHSSQILTKEQLAQITQVLQMRQMQDNDNDSGDHFKKNNIIAHPIANTRIVYRVIYPSEINDNRNNAHQEVERQQHGEEHHDSGRRRGRPRKSHHQRIRDEEEDCKKVGLRLSREEKEAKKKHRPRTRSGRISKPPTYMVKDYKRLHHLDFDHEPFDDSDGGYSDYQFSPEEDFEVDSTVSLFSADMLTNKSKGYKCATCDKAYIGKGGLARHYRLNPTHGTSEDLESDSCSNGSSGTSHASNTKKQTTLFVDFDADSTDKVKDDPSSTTSVDGTKTHEWASVNRRCWDRLKKRGWNRQRKDMKPRLKELLLCYNDDEVKEAALPRLTQTVDVWEFVRRKCLASDSPHSMSDTYQELKKLIDGIRTETRKRLSECHSEKEDGKTYVEVEDQRVANVMGVKVGTYVVKPYLANGESISETIVNRDISIYKEVLLSSSTPSVTAISTKNVNDTSWEHCRIGVVIDAPDDTGTTRVDSSYNHLSDVPDTCGGYNELLEREVMVTDDSYVKQESANKCSGRNGCLTSNCKPNEGSLEEICDCQKPSPVEPIAVKCTQFVGPKESGIENSFPHLPLSLEEGGHLSPCGSFDRNEMGLRNLLLEGDGSTLGILGTLNNHLMTSPITFQQHFEGDSLPQDLDENVEPAVAL